MLQLMLYYHSQNENVYWTDMTLCVNCMYVIECVYELNVMTSIPFTARCQENDKLLLPKNTLHNYQQTSSYSQA